MLGFSISQAQIDCRLPTIVMRPLLSDRLNRIALNCEITQWGPSCFLVFLFTVYCSLIQGIGTFSGRAFELQTCCSGCTSQLARVHSAQAYAAGTSPTSCCSDASLLLLFWCWLTSGMCKLLTAAPYSAVGKVREAESAAFNII
jgi:hypothetical protein